MHRTILKLRRLELENFKPKEAKTDLKITFDKNDVEETITKEVILRNPLELVSRTLFAIKSQGKFIVEEESDNILENIYITRVDDEEKIEERLLLFFKSLCEKAVKLKNTKIASQYMRIFDEIKTMKLEF